MENSQLILLIIISSFWILLGVAGSNLAKKRKRDQTIWFINCLLSGLFGLLVIACSSTLDKDLDPKKVDTLGCVVFFICLIILGLSVWYGYLDTKEYYNRMLWDFTMQLLNR